MLHLHIRDFLYKDVDVSRQKQLISYTFNCFCNSSICTWSVLVTAWSPDELCDVLLLFKTIQLDPV